MQATGGYLGIFEAHRPVHGVQPCHESPWRVHVTARPHERGRLILNPSGTYAEAEEAEVVEDKCEQHCHEVEETAKLA